MSNNTKNKSKSECSVCYSNHDDEIHEATIRVHRWFLAQVTRNFVKPALPAEDFQSELASS